MHWALFFTLSRFIVAPAVVVLLISGYHQRPLVTIIVVVALYTYGGLTDWWDGRWARRHGRISRSGEFLDPLADKVFTLSAFAALLALGDVVYVPLAAVLVIVAREVGVTILRIVRLRQGTPLTTERHGKLKTTIQYFAQGLVWLILLIYAIIANFPSYLTFAQGAGITRLTLASLQQYATVTGALPHWVLSVCAAVPPVVVVIAAVATFLSGLGYLKGAAQKVSGR